MAQTLQLTLSEDLRRRLEVRASVEATQPDELVLRLLAQALPDEADKARERRARVADVIATVKAAQAVEDTQRRAGYLCAAQDRLWHLWQIRPREDERFGPLAALLLDVLRLNPPERWKSEDFTALYDALQALAGDLTEERSAEVVSALQSVGLQTLPRPSDADWEAVELEVDV